MNLLDQKCLPWLDDYPANLRDSLPDLPPVNIVATFDATKEYNTAAS